MTKSEEFRAHAEQALRWAQQATTGAARDVFVVLARTWTAAALYREREEYALHASLSTLAQEVGGADMDASHPEQHGDHIENNQHHVDHH